MARAGIGPAGLLARMLGAVVLVYATFNPTGHSYFHWVVAPLIGMGAPSGGSAALKFRAGVLLLIGWVVMLQPPAGPPARRPLLTSHWWLSHWCSASG